MDTSNKIILVEKLIEHYREIRDNFSQLNKLFGCADGNLTEAVWKSINSYIEAISTIINDKDKYLEWYIIECNCGANNLSCFFKGKEYKITSAKDLVEFIELTG